MLRFSCLLIVALLAVAATPIQAATDAALVQRFLTTYCTDCHGAAKQKGDRRFDKLLLPAAKVDTLIELKDIMDQIHLGEMPPKKSPQPSPAEQKAFLEQVAQALA